jgi:hypothetical protein
VTQTARPTDASSTTGETPAETSAETTDELAGLDALVGTWLPLPDVAERLDIEVGKVRRLVQDRALLALRRGDPKVWSVPELFLVELEGRLQPVPDLKGTVTVLADAGYDDVEALRWLFTPDASLPGTPIDALRANNRKTEVRRRAQALAF